MYYGLSAQVALPNRPVKDNCHSSNLTELFHKEFLHYLSGHACVTIKGTVTTQRRHRCEGKVAVTTLFTYSILDYYYS